MTQSKSINDISEEEFADFLGKYTKEGFDPTHPCDENLVDLASAVVRATNPAEKAAILVDLANMSLALADITQGASPGYVTKCLAVVRH